MESRGLLPSPCFLGQLWLWKKLFLYRENLRWVVLGNTSSSGEYELSQMAAAVRGFAGGAPRMSQGVLAGWFTAAEPSGS